MEYGLPEFLDEHTVRLNGRTFNARNWTLAAGSSPAAPSIKGLDATPYLTNKEIFSLDKLPSSMISLGGGPIGMEMSQAFTRLGSRVTVLQRGDQILAREDRDMGESVMERLAGEGLVFHLRMRPGPADHFLIFQPVFLTCCL